MLAELVRTEGNYGRHAFGRAPISFRPSIHSLGRIFREMMPFFGSSCHVLVVYNFNSYDEVVFRGTLGTMEATLADAPRTADPVILIG